MFRKIRLAEILFHQVREISLSNGNIRQIEPSESFRASGFNNAKNEPVTFIPSLDGC